MKINLKSMICVSIFALSPQAWALSASELTAHLQKPQQIEGQFVQQRYLKSLKQPMRTTGTFALKKQTGLFWHVKKPLDVQLRVRPQGIAQWDNTAQTWRNSQQAGQAMQVKLLMAVLGGDMTQLNQQFDLQVSGSLKQWQLSLKPKTTLMTQVFHQITIQGQQAVQQVVLHEKSGDRTVMNFSQIKVNQPLNQAAVRAFQ